MRPVENNGFWDRLDKDIDSIGRRAKDNFHKYQLKQYQTLKVKQPTQQYRNIQNQSKLKNPEANQITNKSGDMNRKTLVQMQKKEKEKQVIMKNRLAYLRNDKNKQHKTIQVAKKKFETLVNVRNKSFREKESLRKRKMSMAQEDKTESLSRIKFVQTAREHKKKSINVWNQHVQITARNRRFESASNQSFILNEKEKMKVSNISKANKTKADIENSRLIISKMSQRKKSFIRSNYKSSLSQKARSLSAHQESNKNLFLKLRKQAIKINAWREKANQQMQEYSSILRVGKKKNQKIPTEQSITQSRSSKSFYLTLV